MYGAVHELKAPFLVTLIQTLPKFAMGQSGSCPDVHRLNAHRFTIAFYNVDFKIIIYSAVHELKAPFLVTLIQTLTKFAWDSLARVLMFIV